MCRPITGSCKLVPFYRKSWWRVLAKAAALSAEYDLIDVDVFRLTNHQRGHARAGVRINIAIVEEILIGAQNENHIF